MGSRYLVEDDLWFVSNSARIDTRDRIDPGVYTLKFVPRRGPALLRQKDFELPVKTFDPIGQYHDRIIRTYLDRPRSTGVILEGERGSGKSLLAKTLSCTLQKDHAIPTLLIDNPFDEEGAQMFRELLSGIDQRIVVIFDEFEKNFEDDQQKMILTLLDGMYQTQDLFIMTVNDRYGINEHMRNRPSRLYYSISFKGITESAVREFCQERLVDQSRLDGILRMHERFRDMNFDILQTLVEEMNRFGESAQEAARLLNARPAHNDDDTYVAVLEMDGKKKTVSDDEVEGNPLSKRRIQFAYRDNDNDQWKSIGFTQHNLEPKDSDFRRGIYVFRKDENVLTLTRNEERSFNHTLLF